MLESLLDLPHFFLQLLQGVDQVITTLSVSFTVVAIVDSTVFTVMPLFFAPLGAAKISFQMFFATTLTMTSPLIQLAGNLLGHLAEVMSLFFKAAFTQVIYSSLQMLKLVMPVANLAFAFIVPMVTLAIAFSFMLIAFDFANLTTQSLQVLANFTSLFFFAFFTQLQVVPLDLFKLSK